MILDALRSELFKLAKNRWSLFWAFGLMPMFALVSGVLEQAWVHFYAGDLIPYAAPLEDSLSGLGFISTSVAQLCAIAGAAIIFGGEYRWETWRAILTRTERIPVMLAKMITFAIAVAASILLCGLARFIAGLLDAALSGRASWPAVGAGEILLAHGLGFLATFFQLMVTAAFAMTVCVVTRTMTAAIVAPLLLLVIGEISSIRYYSGMDLFGAVFPNIAGAGIRQLGQAIMGEPDVLLPHLAFPGAITLAMWFVLFLGMALLAFRAQDLSRE
jgi:ABC-2 type transport system permease protein